VFTGIHHVAVAVRNLDAALAFYRDILGLPVGRQAVVADQGVKAALLPIGEDEIELLEPTNPAGGVARFLEKKGEGIHHLCVETTDIAAALVQAKAANLPLIDQAPRQGLAGMIGFLHPGATQGVLVELAQPAGGGHAHPPAGAGIRAIKVATYYVGVKNLLAAGETFARNFGAMIQGLERDPQLQVESIVAQIGSSRVTILKAEDLAASPDLSRLVGGRTEGLFGICLAVADFHGAVSYLGGKGFPVEVRGKETSTQLARVVSDETHGVSLFLCASK
jgi:methylmalonyl-CoA/ethylmalonyl-CoA epimerase